MIEKEEEKEELGNYILTTLYRILDTDKISELSFYNRVDDANIQIGFNNFDFDVVKTSKNLFFVKFEDRRVDISESDFENIMSLYKPLYYKFHKFKLDKLNELLQSKIVKNN